MKRTIARCISTASVLVFSALALHAESLNIKIQMKSSTFKIGSPVVLYITYMYEGPNEILIPQDYEPVGSGIALRNAETKEEVHRFHEGELRRLTGRGMGLNPGHPVHEAVDLAKYFKLTSAGEYTVMLDKHYGSQGKEATSDTITFTLTQ
jgi:hypothetical protein